MSSLPKTKESNCNYLMQLSEAERSEYLIVNNLRLVIYMSKKFSYNDKEELVSVGTMGLIKAAHTFDCYKDVKFSTYATRCIQNEILMFLRKEKKHYVDISMEEVIATNNYGDELKISDTLVSKETAATKIEAETDIQEVGELVDYLDEQSRLVICHRYGIGCETLTQRQIGKLLGISQPCVCRMEKKALGIMKTEMTRREKMCSLKVVS